MKSIFRYPGGKTKESIQNWILTHMPRGIEEYREPFVGGGGVFWGLKAPERRGGMFRASEATEIKRFWINDKHEGLMEVYRALRDRPEEFIARCKEIAPNSPDDPQTEPGPRGGRPTNARLKGVFDELCLNQEADQALRYLFVNRTVHGSGRVNYDIPSRLYFSNPEGWNIVTNGQMETAASCMGSVKITAGDYRELLTEPGENVWVYLDPPYVVNSNLSRTSQLYQHSFTIEDHREFAKAVAECQHKVCISYDDDAGGLVRELFPSTKFRIVDGQWKYAGTTNAVKDVGRELLILNYDPPSNAIILPDKEQDDLPLTQAEEEELLILEEAIEDARQKSFQSYIEIGESLRKIRDSGIPSQRLYRKTHPTFEDYCGDRWGMTPRHSNRLIAASSLYLELKTGPIGPVLPANEGQMRELVRLESPEAAAEILSTFDEDETLTAKKLKALVDERLGYEPPKTDVWKQLLKWWNKADKRLRRKFLKEIDNE